MFERAKAVAKRALNGVNLKRRQVVHATTVATEESRNHFEDKVAGPYILNKRKIPKQFHNPIIKFRRTYLEIDPNGDLIKHGKTLVRMWVWYSLFTYPRNLRHDSSFITKVSARGLQVFVIIDMLNVLSNVEFKSK